MSNDMRLQDKVLDELRWARLEEPSAVRVEVHDGTVTLAGQVASEEARAAAEWAATRVAGVKSVQCEIVVVSPPPRIIN